MVWMYIAVFPLLCLGTPSYAGIPDAAASSIPNVLIAPPCQGCDGSANYEIQINDPIGPLEGVEVTLVFSENANALLAWCSSQERPQISASTDQTGTATFRIYGGGCIEPSEAPSLPVVQVFANGIFMAEVGIVSPDVVDPSGKKATDPGWDPAGMAACSLSDGAYLGSYITLGIYDFCSDLTRDGIVDLNDAVLMTPFMRSGACCPM
jgi:hypothetical protein